MDIPALHVNWVDLAIILFVLFYIWDGWGKSFISLTIEVVVFIGAFLVALRFYPFAATILVSNFSLPQGLSKAFGFFVLGILLEQLLSYVGSLLYRKIPDHFHKHPINKLLAIIPLFANVIVIVAFILTLLLGLPIRGDVKATVTQSKLGQPLISQTQRIERVLASIFGDAFTDTFNFITIRPGSGETVKLNFTQKDLSIDEISEREMLTLVNQERTSRGRSALRSDTKLRDLSRFYAKDMFERGYFSHYNPEGASPFDRMEEARISYLTAGENLAYAPSVTIAHQGLMESKGHRENILNPDFGRVGIGVIDGGIYGKMFVQEFTD